VGGYGGTSNNYAYDQSDDYSFIDTPQLIENRKIVVYVNGEIAWGDEPGPEYWNPL
jgi:hypothetical protein